MPKVLTTNFGGCLPTRILIKQPCKGYYLRWYYNGWHYWFFLPGELNMLTEGEEYRTIGTRKVRISSGQIDYCQAQAIRTILLTRDVYILTDDGWKSIRTDQGKMITYKNQINGYGVELSITIGSKEISLETGYSPVVIIPEVPPDPNPAICEVIIGTQVWACYNYDSDYPGSKVYNNNEANRAIYGGLYSYAQITASGFAPPGWHVPTQAEWETLFAYVGGIAIAGGELKEIGLAHWDAPNTGAVDTYGFIALPGGQYNNFLAAFSGLGVHFTVWSSTQRNATQVWVYEFDFNSVVVVPVATVMPNFHSVRLIKDTAPIFNDWFLPSRDLLNEMYINLHLFGVGGFSPSLYWSSSESNAANARVQSFNDGAQGSLAKGSAATYTRACRSFIASIGAYSLRDTGPAGGLICYIDGAGTTYYESTITDQSVSQAWSNITAVAVTGTGTVIGTGLANSNLIVAQPGHTDSSAQLCLDLVI
jgi:uncharacterized protein (TIGR02145 family)